MAIVCDPSPVCERLRVAGPGRDELLLPVEHEPDRPAGSEHKVADDVLDDHFLLRAETAAHAGLDDANGLDREPEQWREHAADVEGHLRGRPQHQPLILVEPADCGVRLDRGVLHLLDIEGRLEDVVGPGEGGVHLRIADSLALDVVADVVRRVEDPHGVRFVVDDRRALGKCRLGIQYRRQNLVGDIDQAARLLGDLGRLGGDSCDPIADVAHLVVEAHLVVRTRVGPALTARGVLHPRRVAVVHHSVHSWQRRCLRIVDRDDARVCMRAPQDLRVQHPAKLDVVGEGCVALDETQSFHLVLRFADHRGLRNVRGGHKPRHSRRHVEHERRQRLSQLEIPRQGLDDERLHRVGLLAAEHRRSAADCFDHLGVAGLAVKDPRQRVADLLIGGIGSTLEEGLGRQHHGPGRVPGLERPRLDERLLDRVHLSCRHVQRLDRSDRVPVCLGGKKHVG